MERIVMNLVLLNACFDISSAFTSKHTMERLDLIEDRLNAESNRLNTESRFRREGFNALLDKVDRMELMLNKLLEKKETESTVSEISDKTVQDVSTNTKMTILLKSFKMEKNENKRFKREILQDVNKQAELTHEAYVLVENSLDNITQEIKQLKQQTLQHEIDSDNMADQVIQRLEENTKNMTFLLNGTMQNAVNKQTELIKENFDRVENSLDYITKEINQSKNETRQHDIDSDKKADQLIQILEEKSRNTTSVLNNVMQKAETILVDLNGTSELIKDQEHLHAIMQTQLEKSRYACLNETGGLAKNLEVILKLMRKYVSCLDLYNNGIRLDGIYDIQTGPAKTDISVYCDMTTDGGGWAVFQRRQDGSEDFRRDWNDYKYGFGKLDGEFWLGNEYINLLTGDGKIHELRIDLEDFEGDQAYAKYNKFKIGPESTNYKLEVSGYTGNASDSLNRQSSNDHNGMQFSTKDRDNDIYSGNCASNLKGGWWFSNCLWSHLNGVYNKQKECTDWTPCILWTEWKDDYHNMKFTEMKLR